MMMLESLGKVKVGIWQFWRIVANRNRDLPFYDYDKETWTYVEPNGV
jgi:hypothetical protein